MDYSLSETPIQKISFPYCENEIFMKREDLLPFSFGGNKVRIAYKYFEEIIKNGYDCVISYGSSSSNMNRVISNMCASLNIPCYVIIPKNDKEKSSNSKILELLGSEIILCDKEKVEITIQNTLDKIREDSYKPYYIYGDATGSGNESIAIQAYKEVYKEIKKYEEKKEIYFDFIFHASGTGMTQAGLLSGQYEERDSSRIIGISIARKKEKSILAIYKILLSSYDKEIASELKSKISFEDKYLVNGYGEYNNEIIDVIKGVFKYNGIGLNTTYTGKAFWGMLKYLEENKIIGKKILFINTGGTPLFFDDLNNCYKGEKT